MSKNLLIDFSINFSNPYCGISKDTEEIFKHLTPLEKQEAFHVKKLILSSTPWTSLFFWLSKKLTPITAEKSILTTQGDGYLSSKIKGLFGIKTKIDTQSIDVFISQRPDNYTLHNNTKKVVRIHDIIPITNPETAPLLRNSLFKKNFAHNIKENSYFICNSEATKKQVATLFPEVTNNCTVIPCSSNLNTVKAYYEPTNNLPKTFSLVVSSLEPKKNLYNFLLAWEKSQIENPELLPLVLLANEGWKNFKLKKLLRRIKDSYPNRIFHLQKISLSNLAYLYKNCSYFIMPSILEGFGIPVLDALQFSKPSILSNIEVFHEIAGKSALYFDPLSIKDISRKIMQIDGNAPLQKNLITHAKKQQSLYDSNSIAKQWQGLIHKILANNPNN